MRSPYRRRLKNKWAHDTDTVFHMLWNTHQQRQRLAANRDYPDELVWALIRKGYDTMRNGKEFHLTDPNGTDLRWTLDEQMWEGYNELWGDIVNNHSPRIHLSDNPEMQGVFVSDTCIPAGSPRLNCTLIRQGHSGKRRRQNG